MARPILPNTWGSIVRINWRIKVWIFWEGRKISELYNSERGVMQSKTMLNQSFSKSEFHEKDLIYFLITESVALNKKEVFWVLERDWFDIHCSKSQHHVHDLFPVRWHTWGLKNYGSFLRLLHVVESNWMAPIIW